MSVFRNQASGAYRRWEPPSFSDDLDHGEATDTSSPDQAQATGADRKMPESTPEPELVAPAEPAIKLPTAADIEAMFDDARKEGYETGYDEGKVAAREQAERLAGLADSFDESLKRLDQDIADEIVALAIEVARQMVRHTLADHPSAINETVRAALQQLPQSDARIHLHPDDASLVRDYLNEEFEQAHQLVEDDTLTRGGCRVVAPGSEVDATLETRWRRVLAAMGRTDADWQDED